MNEIVYEKHFKIKETEDRVVKTSVQGWNINEMWLVTYNKFRDFCLNNNCSIIPIEVHNADTNSIEMEKIDSIDITEHLGNIFLQYKKSRDEREKIKKDFLLKSFSAGLDFQKNIMDFNLYLHSISQNHYWNYKDFSLKNIHISKDEKWHALDPDSWRADKSLNINGSIIFQFTITQKLAELHNY